MSNDDELADYAIGPDPGTSSEPAQRDDADLVADAMKALEDRILARVTDAKEQDQVRDLISDLLDLAPGQALTPEATRDVARRVLGGPRRTLDDQEINTYARFRPYSVPVSDADTEALPAIGLGGDEDGYGEVQVYAYALDGRVIVSLHFDSAGPDEEGSGPWAYYGRDGAIPVTVIGGNGEPVYVADAATPDLSDALTAEAHDAIRCLREVLEPDDIDHEELRGTAEILAGVLRAFLAITGRADAPGNLPEGGS